MKGQRIAYKRVSTVIQSTQRQLLDMSFDKVFEDKLSGKSRERPQLEAMLEHVREGDHIFVHSMDRLARNVLDLRNIVDGLMKRGVNITFVKNDLSFTGETSADSMLRLNIMAAFAEFERELMLERQKEGIAIAKAAGKYKGRKKALNDEQEQELRDKAALGVSKAQLGRDFGISRETVYKYLK